jgi:hypothetical protein
MLTRGDVRGTPGAFREGRLQVRERRSIFAVCQIPRQILNVWIFPKIPRPSPAATF